VSEPLRVIVVDDSPFVCQLLSNYLSSSPDIQVVGTETSGSNAVKTVKKVRPDAVTLDQDMPEMSGLETLEQMMQECPTPVIIISGVSRQAADLTLRALEIGAVDFILKYSPGVDTDPEIFRKEVVTKVQAAAQVKVIRSLRSGHLEGKDDLSILDDSGPQTEYASEETPRDRRVRRSQGAFPPEGVVVIGASTGGPIALRDLLGALPHDFPAAVIIVQHLPAAFTRVLATQLNRGGSLEVKEAESGDLLVGGKVFIAPGDFHLLISSDLRIELSKAPEIRGHRPSVNVTMQSVAQQFGALASGVILSGMGDDGAQGIVSVRSKGGKTFAQEASTCVVDGMPQRAIDKGVVDYIASPAEIAYLLQMEFERT
jgi:two-component system chemotaxis response regulator CheB